MPGVSLKMRLVSVKALYLFCPFAKLLYPVAAHYKFVLLSCSLYAKLQPATIIGLRMLDGAEVYNIATVQAEELETIEHGLELFEREINYETVTAFIEQVYDLIIGLEERNVCCFNKEKP